MIVSRGDWAGHVADVPEFRTSIIAARRHVVLSIRIEIQVADGLAVRVLHAVHGAFIDAPQIHHLGIRRCKISQLNLWKFVILWPFLTCMLASMATATWLVP